VSNAVLASYLIGLREGLEGTLVVSILVAYLVKSGRSGRLPQVWAGVAAALALALAFGAGLTYAGVALGAKKELFEAITSVAAVCFVTWMIFWMRRTSRRLKGELTSRLEDALKLGSFAVVAMAFLTVAREGLETALLFFAAVQGATTAAGPLLGISAGILTSVVIGYLLYRAAIRINLGTFFTWTGVLLVLVAAGIFKYGIHDFQEAGLPGLNTYAFDISSWYDPNAWYTALLTGMFNITAQPSVAETIGWVAYAVVVLALFLWPSPRTSAKSTPQAPPDRADATV
jgi:high-affinity iron transporter